MTTHPSEPITPPHTEPRRRRAARRGPRPRSAGAAAALLLAAAALAAGCELFPERSPGEKLWRKYCAECHGLTGAGNTPRYMGKVYADLLDDTWRVGGETSTLRESTRTGFFGEMPAFDQLSDEEIRQVVDYLRELRGEIAPGSAR
jgi:mono/diheme cytochrome c family protein